MTTYYPTPPEYTTKPYAQWNTRDFFEREVDSHCGYHTLTRYRSREWVEFTERFLPYCDDWRIGWVAGEAWREFTLYLRHPDGEYEPREYPDGCSFHPDDLARLP